MAREAEISNWLAVFGAPEFLFVGKDMWFIGEIFQDFRPSRSIVLQAVIHGNHQILGEVELRRGHFRIAIDHIIGNRKANCPTKKEWGFPAMTTMRLNSEV